MSRLISAVLATTLVLGFVGVTRADDEKQDAKAILDKAIKALGGEDKLKTFTAATWKTKGTLSFNGNESEISTEATVDGLDKIRNMFEGDFGGNKFVGVTVLNGDKGWRKLGDMLMDMDENAIANEKRRTYLQVIPAKILPLTTKEYKVEAMGEEKVDGKAAVGIKAVGPDGKSFQLLFDKESGLPVKLMAVVANFQGDDVEEEVTYGNYKEFDGIKKATKLEMSQDGQAVLTQEVTEFKILKDVDSKTFDEPTP